LLGTLYAVVLSNDDIFLIKGDPSGRRKFADIILSQISADYLNALQNYKQVLREKNFLLKSENIKDNLLDTYNQQQALYGTKLIAGRHKLTVRLSLQSGEIFKKFSRGNDEFMILYKSIFEIDEKTDTDSIYKAFFSELDALKNKEKKRKVSLAGPHLDDFEIMINGKPARAFGSEGQKRAGAVALKIAEYNIAAEKFKEPPLVLVDEVFGELDNQKKEFLNEVFDKRAQMFITCTDEKNTGSLSSGARKYRVENGKITKI